MNSRVEEWRETEFAGYRVSCLGRITAPSGKIMKPYLTGSSPQYPTIEMRGSANPRAVLCESDVIAIRSSTDSGVKLARQFGVTSTKITQIRKNKCWKHVALCQ